MGPTARGEHTVPAALLVQLVELVKRWNVTPEELLGGLGLREQDLEDGHARFPNSVHIATVERARQLTGEPGLGFCWGLQMRASAIGFLGFATMSAPTLRGALELAIHYSPLISTAVGLRLHVAGDVASIIFEEHDDFGSVHDVVLITRIVGLWNIARTLAGRELPGTAELAIPEPSYHRRFAHLVPPVTFGQPVTRVVTSAEVLDTPLLMADATALRLACEQCEQMLDAISAGGRLVGTVRRLLWKRDGGLRSPLEIAEAVNMSPRTLRRNLALQGSSLSALLTEERRDRALLLLRSPDLSIEEVTERLGYWSVQNFTRAFRQWTGTTPAAYRRAGKVRS